MTRPLYLQVYDALVERVAGGEWRPGGLIPNELDLAREYGVSAGTMRKALELMEGERIVTRRQGRGTFVIDQTSADLPCRLTDVHDPNRRRVVGHVEMIDVSEGAANEHESERLQLGTHASVYRMRSIRRHENRPYMIEHISMPAALFPKLLQTNGFPHDIPVLARSHGMLIGKAEERISVSTATTEVAEALDVAPGSPLIVLDRVMLTLDGRRIEWRLGQCHLATNYYLAQMG